MNDTLTLTGVIATDPQVRTTAGGVDMTSFRLASSQRRFDRAANRWVDGETNWYSVTAFRQLASNAGRSLAKGDRVVVVGRLRIRRWEQAERSGSSVDVDAETIGHDLNWGTASYARVQRQPSEAGRMVDETFPDTVAPADAHAGSDAHTESELVPF